MLQSRKNLFGIGFICLSGVLAFLFQNCGSMSPSNIAILNQSNTEVQYSNDQAALLRLMNSPSFQTWISAQTSTTTLAGSTVASIMSVLSNAMNFSPVSGTTGPALGSSPTLSPNPIMIFNGPTTLATSSSQTFFSNSASIVMLIEGTSVVGKVASINDGAAGSNEFGIRFGSGVAQLSHSNSTGNSESLPADLHLVQSTQDDFILAVAFGQASTAITAQINGIAVSSTPTVTGTPGNAVYTTRNVTIGDPTVSSGFKVAEMMVFSSELAAAELNTLTRYMAKKWNVPATMAYIPFSSGASTATTDPLPNDVAAIISICVNCHTGTHAAWGAYGVSDFVAQGLVIPGSAATSPIYEQTSSGSMPLDNPLLTPAQLTTLQTWINGL